MSFLCRPLSEGLIRAQRFKEMGAILGHVIPSRGDQADHVAPLPGGACLPYSEGAARCSVRVRGIQRGEPDANTERSGPAYVQRLRLRADLFHRRLLSGASTGDDGG